MNLGWKTFTGYQHPSFFHTKVWFYGTLPITISTLVQFTIFNVSKQACKFYLSAGANLQLAWFSKSYIYWLGRFSIINKNNETENVNCSGSYVAHYINDQDHSSVWRTPGWQTSLTGHSCSSLIKSINLTNMTSCYLQILSISTQFK